jgi:hypothetical protein
MSPNAVGDISLIFNKLADEPTWQGRQAHQLNIYNTVGYPPQIKEIAGVPAM